jgi:hypothetical protein
MKDRLRRLAFALCLLIPVSGTAGCAYEYSEPVHTPVPAYEQGRMPTAGPTSTAPKPYNDRRILELEARNYAQLDRLLGELPEPVLLSEVGPLDGPVRGFGKTARVPAAGRYTVTAACVGASGADISVGQEHPGAPFRPLVLALDCAGSTSHVLELQQGYVFAHLTLPSPGDTPWTGAVGGVRVSRMDRSPALTGRSSLG